MQTPNTILVVLGYPANNDGSPGPILQARLDKAIELYRKGLAWKIIVTGAAVGNDYVESEVMKQYCVDNGIPTDDIYTETNAKNTYQNAGMVRELMLQKGFTHAIVVTSSFHKMRAEIFFTRQIKQVKIVPAPFPPNFPMIKRLYFLLKEYLIIFLYNLGLLNKRYSIQKS